MTDSLLLRIQRGKTRALTEAVESWQADHAGAMRAREVEQLIAECLRMREEMRGIYQEAFDRMAADRSVDYHQIGLALKELFEKNLQFMESVQRMAQQVDANGHAIEGRKDLDRMLADLRPRVQEVFERWPWLPTPEEVAEAKAAMARGDYQSAEEIVRELQSKRAQTDS